MIVAFPSHMLFSLIASLPGRTHPICSSRLAVSRWARIKCNISDDASNGWFHSIKQASMKENATMGKFFTFGRLLRILGMAAAGTVVGATADGDKVFAKQFACEGVQVRLPDMIYDSGLQMMVDPVTRAPIYERGKKFAQNPTVTAGCSDCPKCDDNCE
jgi:hypothetical protein